MACDGSGPTFEPLFETPGGTLYKQTLPANLRQHFFFQHSLFPCLGSPFFFAVRAATATALYLMVPPTVVDMEAFPLVACMNGKTGQARISHSY